LRRCSTHPQHTGVEIVERVVDGAVGMIVGMGAVGSALRRRHTVGVAA